MIRSLLVAGMMTIVAVPAAAVTRTDATGDFLATYTGAHGGDLDVLKYSTSIVGSDFVISSTMNGAIGTTAGGIYVWGVNRGKGTAGFGASLGLTKVLFDSVIVLQPDGKGLTVVFNTGGPPTITPLAAGSITIVGDTITGTIPIAFFPSDGFDAPHYGFNLWPRLAGGTVANIADFAPNDGTINSIPEPASWALLVAGFAVVGGTMRRWSRMPAATA